MNSISSTSDFYFLGEPDSSNVVSWHELPVKNVVFNEVGLRGAGLPDVIMQLLTQCLFCGEAWDAEAEGRIVCSDCYTLVQDVVAARRKKMLLEVLEELT